MKNQEQVTIGECCEILDSMRIPLNSEQRALIPGDIPYYGANGVQGYINDYLFDEDLILIAEDGGYFDEYSTRPIAYRIYGKSWVNNHAHILKAKDCFVQDFIFYSLEHKDIIKFIKGGTRSKLNQAELKEVTIWKAPYQQQQKIAKILTTIDQLIEKTQALIDKHTAIKQGMMTDLFTRGIDPTTGQLRPPVEQAPHLYKETELGWIPKEWDVKPLGEIATRITSGSRDWASYYSDEGDLFIRISNLTREHINFRWDSVKYVDIGNGSEGERTLLEDGDVLISITADLGIVGVVNESIGRAFINQHTALLRIKNEVNCRFVGNFLNSNKGQRQFEELNDSGAKAGLNLPTVGSILCSVPEKNEQDEITRRIDKLDVVIDKYKNEKGKYLRLKYGLMQDLLTGKVSI